MFYSVVKILQDYHMTSEIARILLVIKQLSWAVISLDKKKALGVCEDMRNCLAVGRLGVRYRSKSKGFQGLLFPSSFLSVL